MALHTQACRQMRSIIEECSRCEAFGADIAARSLFETVLALIFITRPNVHLITFPQMNKQTNQQKITADGRLKYGVKRPDVDILRQTRHLLSPSLRADLYRVNVLFSTPRARRRKCRTPPDAGSVAHELEQMVDEGTVIAAESWIGPVWTYILRDQGSYSGLKVLSSVSFSIQACFAGTS